ncbi:hypothetical protein FoTM2_015690 [Fusarium oxysporum f. sp. vasinfectum]|nr:hypothetical protein FoTM2_015690 [Fusarium oxysporum f. sp. vasinfectum]
MPGQYLMPITVRSITGQMPAALAAEACVRLQPSDRGLPSAGSSASSLSSGECDNLLQLCPDGPVTVAVVTLYLIHAGLDGRRAEEAEEDIELFA